MTNGFEFDKYRAAAKKIASENHAVFVPFQSMFDEAIKYTEPSTGREMVFIQVLMELP